jgi:hypothetical protein
MEAGRVAELAGGKILRSPAIAEVDHAVQHLHIQAGRAGTAAGRRRKILRQKLPPAGGGRFCASCKCFPKSIGKPP